MNKHLTRQISWVFVQSASSNYSFAFIALFLKLEVGNSLLCDSDIHFLKPLFVISTLHYSFMAVYADGLRLDLSPLQER